MRTSSPTAPTRQIAAITIAAVVIFVTMRLLPTGTNLSHMDFRLDGNAKNSIEFCDPLNPQFIPVVAVRSPVMMSVSPDRPAETGQPVSAILILRTASGKPIAPEDLLIANTKRLHLLIVDPTLTDYQHVHPEPAKKRGDWTFAFTPRLSGAYRIFADFTPVATGRGLYANADLKVAPSSDRRPNSSHTLTPPSLDQDGYHFALTPSTSPIRAGQPTDLKFAVTRTDGSRVPLEPVMGAFAHLVAFDQARSGFAHLHPLETDLSKPPDAAHPVLNFKITIPVPGRYVIWGQVNLGGTETFAPFWFQVL